MAVKDAMANRIIFGLSVSLMAAVSASAIAQDETFGMSQEEADFQFDQAFATDPSALTLD